MKRNRFSSRKRISADATELGRLAIGLAESGSKIEDLFWQKRLAELVDRLLHDGAEEDLNASLDRLFDTHAMAHDDLADIVESQAESCTMLDRGQDFDVLLIAVPVLGWSRFSIPATAIPVSYTHLDVYKRQALKNSVAGSNVSVTDLPSNTLKMASAIVATGPILLLYPFVQKYFVSGITIGAVKG